MSVFAIGDWEYKYVLVSSCHASRGVCDLELVTSSTLHRKHESMSASRSASFLQSLRIPFGALGPHIHRTRCTCMSGMMARWYALLPAWD